MTGLLLGIDIGTSTSKGVLVDESGSVVARAAVPSGFANPAVGHYEQDADRVWWGGATTLTRELLKSSGASPSRIVGVGVSAISPCVLPLDVHDRPLRPGILYGIDSRAGAQVRTVGRLARERGEDVSLSSQSTVPKMLWLRENEPELWQRTRRVVGAEGYLVLRLTGRHVLDRYDANAYRPLIGPDAARWLPGFEDLVPTSLLPELVWPAEVVGTVSPAAAEETGLVAGTPVVAGIADAAAEATSAGFGSVGDLMAMYGSTAFFILATAVARASGRFWPAVGFELGTHVLSGGMNTVGTLTQWFRDEFGTEEVARESAGGESAFAQLAELAEQSPPGARGLLALPYFAGERTPIDDPRARGVLAGLTLEHSRADVYRALLEGVALGVRANVDGMRAEGHQVRRLLAVGGGTMNRALLQAVSDATGVAQLVPRERVGASLGDALRAGVGVGVFDDLAQAAGTVVHEEPIEPRPELRELYDDRFEQFTRLYEATAPVVRALGERPSR